MTNLSFSNLTEGTKNCFVAKDILNVSIRAVFRNPSLGDKKKKKEKFKFKRKLINKCIAPNLKSCCIKMTNKLRI